MKSFTWPRLVLVDFPRCDSYLLFWRRFCTWVLGTIKSMFPDIPVFKEVLNTLNNIYANFDVFSKKLWVLEIWSEPRDDNGFSFVTTLITSLEDISCIWVTQQLFSSFIFPLFKLKNYFKKYSRDKSTVRHSVFVSLHYFYLHWMVLLP